MDISTSTLLAPLAEAIGGVQRAARRAGVEVFIVGALARDLWLEFAFGVRTRRATSDVDFGVSCRNWSAFEGLRRELLADRDFEPLRAAHKFKFRNGTELDIVPFGGLERPDRRIAWPSDESQEMNALGFAEVADTAVAFELPGGISVPVLPLASLAILKFVAWDDRKNTVGKDAADIAFIARKYLDAGNGGRIDEVMREDFDYEEAGAELLGRDMAVLSQGALRRHLDQLLERETEPEGLQRFVGHMQTEERLALRLLEAIRRGFDEVQ